MLYRYQLNIQKRYTSYIRLMLFVCGITYCCAVQRDTIVLTNGAFAVGSGSVSQQQANFWLHERLTINIAKDKTATIVAAQRQYGWKDRIRGIQNTRTIAAG